MASCDIKVKLAWWLKPYIWGVATVSMLTGCEPDWAKVERVIKRAIRMRVV